MANAPWNSPSFKVSRMIPLRSVLLGLLLVGSANTFGEDVTISSKNLERTFELQITSDLPKEMHNLCGDVVKVSECNPEAAQKLEKASEAVVKTMSDGLVAASRVFWSAHPDELDQDWMWDYLIDILDGDGAQKAYQAAEVEWDKALTAHLTESERGKWQEELKARKDKVVKVMSGAIDKLMSGMDEKTRKEFPDRVDTLAQNAKMSKERAALLGPAAEASRKAYLAEMQKVTKQYMDATRANFIFYNSKAMADLERNWSSQNFFFGVSSAEKAAKKVFEEGWSKILNDEEKGYLKQAVDKRETRVVAVANNMAETSLARLEGTKKTSSLGRLQSLARTLNFDENKKKELKAKLEEGEKGVWEQWKKTATAKFVKDIHRTLKNADEESRLKEMESGNWWFNDPSADKAATQGLRKVWDTVVGAAVRPEDKSRWDKEEDRKKEAQILMMAHMAVAEMDLALQLQPDQRREIEPLMVEVAKKASRFEGDLMEVWRQSFGGSLVLVPGLPEKQMLALLDDKQATGFKEMKKRMSYQWEQLQQQLPEEQ